MTYLTLAMRYWKLAAMGVLLIALGIQTARLSRTNDKLDTRTAQLETANAKLTALADESDRRKAEGKRAVEADKPRSAQRQAARTIIVHEPGVCDTSSDIAEALDRGWVR